MGKFQSGFLKKHIIFPGCILLSENKYVRVEHFDPGKVVNFGPDEDLILGSLMSHPHCTRLLDDAGMRRMTSK